MLQGITMKLNYLEVIATAREEFTFRLSDELSLKLDCLKEFKDNSRIDLISYLIRLFNAVDPEVDIIPADILDKKVRKKSGGVYLPEDVVEIIRDVSKRSGLSLTHTFDYILYEAIKLSKTYTLNIGLVKKPEVIPQ